jgi:hypothetical protein
MKKIITTTLGEAIEVLQIAEKYKGEKFEYATQKLAKKIQKAQEELFEETEDKRVELASTDEKGNILKDERGNFVFSPENLIKLNKFSREKFKKPIDLEVYYSVEVPKEITEFHREMLTGFLIAPEEK